MTPKKLYYLLLVCLALTIAGLLSSGFIANGLLTKKAATLSKLKAEVENQSDLQVALSRNKRELRTYEPLNQVAKAIVPQEKDQAITVREISRMATESNIQKLSSITFPASSLGGTSASSSAPGNKLSQLTPIKGLSGVSLLPITVSLSSSTPTTYGDFISFLSKLEQNRRTAQVTSINITPDASDPSRISFTLVINKYVKQ